MRTLSLFVLLVTAIGTAQAQAPLFPNGTAATRAVPHWRVGVGAGFANEAMTGTGSLSVERTVRDAVSVGARAAGYSGGGFTDDGTTMEGGSLDVFATAGTRDRVLDLRAGVGLGVSLVDVTSGGLEPSCFEDEDGFLVCYKDATQKSTSYFGPEPYALALIGMDLYLTSGVGLGAEVRAVLMDTSYTLSSAEIGLRVRLAR